MKTTVEKIAKVLLNNGVSFKYDVEAGKSNPYLTILDPKVTADLFMVACYHFDTKKLVLMCADYTKEITVEEFNNYFNIK